VAVRTASSGESRPEGGAILMAGTMVGWSQSCREVRIEMLGSNFQFQPWSTDFSPGQGRGGVPSHDCLGPHRPWNRISKRGAARMTDASEDNYWKEAPVPSFLFIHPLTRRLLALTLQPDAPHLFNSLCSPLYFALLSQPSAYRPR
jgi:hypothetical protein